MRARWVLFALIVLGGIMVVVCNLAYPLARERETKERLARDALALLMPEIRQNEAIVANMQELATRNEIPSGTLDVAAWQTISSGGLLSGLKPEEATKLLKVYTLIFQVNAVNARLIESTIGVASALGNAAQTRGFFMTQLQARLSALRQAFSEIDTKS